MQLVKGSKDKHVELYLGDLVVDNSVVKDASNDNYRLIVRDAYGDFALFSPHVMRIMTSSYSSINQLRNDYPNLVLVKRGDEIKLVY